MREIKFRVWDTKNKKYLSTVPVDECRLDGQLNCGLGSSKQWTEAETFNDRLIYQQYIGIKDKHGKEIYEGDIIQYNDNANIDGIDFICEYDNDKLQFVFTNKENDIILTNLILPCGDNRFDYIEVAGNIYEQRN